MVDYVTPNFHKAIAQGAIINNPMAKSFVSEFYTGGTYHARFIAYSNTTPRYYLGWEADGNWFGSIAGKSNQYIAVPSMDIATLTEQAIIEAYSKNKGNDTLLLATLGELKETVSSIHKLMKDAVGIFRSLRKFELKALARLITPKELANRWMEARYAIRPLVYDISSNLAAWEQSDTMKRITARGRVTGDTTSSDEVKIHWDSNSEIYAARSTTCHVECRAGVMSVIENLSKINIWGVDQLMTSAWELVPLSFVVDWFFNVGKLISAWEPTIGLRALASWVTVKKTIIQRCEVSRCVVIWAEPRKYAAEISHYCKSEKTWLLTDRTPRLSLPLYPSFKYRLDEYKLLDLGIIIKNIFR